MCEFGMFGPSQAVSVCVSEVFHIFLVRILFISMMSFHSRLWQNWKLFLGHRRFGTPTIKNWRLTTTWTKFDHKKGNVTGSKSNLLWENACCSFQLYHWSYCIPGDRDCVDSYTDSLQISDTFDIGAYSISLMLSRRLLKKQNDWDKSLWKK